MNLGLPVEADEFAELSTDEIAQRMQFLGLPAELVSRAATRRTTTSNLLPLRSSLDGRGRRIGTSVEGEVVDTKTTLFDVADTSRLWLKLNVRQEDAKYVSLGQTVLFQRERQRESSRTTKGTVSWISTGSG